MLNVLLALALGTVVFAGVGIWLGAFAGIVPGLLVAVIAFFLLARRTGQVVQREMDIVLAQLQARQVPEAQAGLRALQHKYGRWQLLLTGQVDAQLGMIAYLQRDWEAALPLLESGRWRNWAALACIACIHYRRDEKAKTWEYLKKAVDAAPKEAILRMVFATLLHREGKRDEALAILSSGLKESPDNKPLLELQATIANKRKIDTKQFPQTWYQFFPEDMANQAVMKGRRDGSGPPQVPGSPTPPKLNRKMRRST
jgi:tetratricopeptide (TPR) repeat protein